MLTNLALSKVHMHTYKFSLFFFSLAFCLYGSGAKSQPSSSYPLVADITVQGSNYLSASTILSRLPYQKGKPYNSSFSREAIQAVDNLGCFEQVVLLVKEKENNEVSLCLVVEEEKLLAGINIEGNKRFTRKQLQEKVPNLNKFSTISSHKAEQLCREIKKQYQLDNYHQVKVQGMIVPDKENTQKASVTFSIEEGPCTAIRKVSFEGNNKIPSYRLESLLFSREQWLFSFLDQAGKFSEEMLNVDKYRLEFWYQDQGYLMARVAAEVNTSEDGTAIDILFKISEGEQFKVRNITVQDDLKEWSEEELARALTIQEGEWYSRSKVIATIDRLKDIWGEKGYIYADVYPHIEPNVITSELDITFVIQRGEKMKVNSILITGNHVTKDSVIRRQITLEEGELITSSKLKQSKENVEYLSFFERGSVNWKIHKLGDEQADLELCVKEMKTGHVNFTFSYGGDQSSVRSSARFGVDIAKNNFLGYGWDVGGMIQANTRYFHRAQLRFFDPYFLDSNVALGINAYLRREEYDQWVNITPVPIERTKGLLFQAFLGLPWIDRRLQLAAEINLEKIQYNKYLTATVDRFAFQPIIDRTFVSGEQYWMGVSLIRDTRNHKMVPSDGCKIEAFLKAAFPFVNPRFSFIKAEAEVSWYTPLIGLDTLVFLLHAKAGFIEKLEQEKIIPYKELYHMGGQGTVRGFVWGGVGPAWGPTDSPLGAKKALQCNMELIFPLVPDYAMKGHLFYDAGAGWDTPKDCINNTNLIKRDQFNIRHSVGFGIAMLRPVPAKIDWGYKLDRKKKEGESAHELHISMNYAW